MEEKLYLFRREDTGEVIEVPFSVMMRQDRAGYVTLDDGVKARRCVHLELERDGKPQRFGGDKIDTLNTPLVSDAMGFPVQAFGQWEADRVKYGFTGVEFVKDPTCEYFYQVKFGSRAERERYIKHRCLVDKSALGGGIFLTQADLDRAAELVSRN